MSNRERTSSGRPSEFSPELRRDAVAMALGPDRPIAEVRRAIGVGPGTLGKWVSTERAGRAALAGDERAGLAELRAECKQLRTERE
ncbi:MAG: transposase, partial [Acidimicrobiales bacterium]